MKKLLCLLITAALALSLAACNSGSQEAEESNVVVIWSDYYWEGKEAFDAAEYEQAIEAFTNAIELDAEQAPVYVCRGDCYVLKPAESDAEINQNLDLAWDDYETASGLDETYAEAYLGMADVLIRQGSFEQAYNLLSSSQNTVSDGSQIAAKLAEIESGQYVDSSRQVRRMDHFNASGVLYGYTTYEYDFLGRKCGWYNYLDSDNNDSNGITIELATHCIVTFGDNGLPLRNDYYAPDGSLSSYQTMEYDERGLETRRDTYTGENVLRTYFLTYYDEDGRETGYDTYNADGSMSSYHRYDYDDNGNLIQDNMYDPSGNLIGVDRPSGN